MSAAGGLALTLAAALAAGGVVDVGGTAEVRSNLVGFDPGTQDGPGTVGLYSVVARPNLQAAYEHPRAAARLIYAPSLSVVVPAQQLLLALHTGSAGAELVLTRRLTLRARGSGVIGDLDPGAAQRELFTSLGVVDRSQALAYAAGNFEVAAQARLTRLATLDIVGTMSGVGSPAATLGDAPPLRTIATQTFGARTTLALTRADAVTLEGTLRNWRIVDGGERGDQTATGVLALAGYRRSLFRGGAVELRAGGVPIVADAADGEGRKLVLLPAADARTSASLDLGGGAALVGDASAGLMPFTDPLGPLVESRLAAQVGLGARFTRDAVLRASAFAGTPVFSFGSASALGAGSGVSASFQWAFAQNASLEVSAISLSRMLPRVPEKPRVLAVELAVACGVTGTFNVLHSGARPRGTDTRPGRSLEARDIGTARAPHQEAEPEPAFESIPIDAPEAEPLPPELVPPPVQPPLEIDMSPTDRRRRRSSDKKPTATEEAPVDDLRAPRRGKDRSKDEPAADEKSEKESPKSEPKSVEEEP